MKINQYYVIDYFFLAPTGSKFDGCFFDFCEFFTRDHCVSNSQADIEGVSMESYVFDEELAKTMEESYGNQDVELAIQRIPQP